VALATALSPCFAACTPEPDGTLNPGGVGGVVVTAMPRSTDGRDIVFGTTLANSSDSQSITFEAAAVDLIGAQGVEYVDAFTVGMNSQVAVGTPVPPQFSDGSDPVFAQTQVDNWASRVPLDHSTLAPQAYLQLLVQVRVTTSDDCAFADGIRIRYREYGKRLLVNANLATVYFYGASGDQCHDVYDHLLATPIG